MDGENGFGSSKLGAVRWIRGQRPLAYLLSCQGTLLDLKCEGLTQKKSRSALADFVRVRSCVWTNPPT